MPSDHANKKQKKTINDNCNKSFLELVFVFSTTKIGRRLDKAVALLLAVLPNVDLMKKGHKGLATIATIIYHFTFVIITIIYHLLLLWVSCAVPRGHFADCASTLSGMKKDIPPPWRFEGSPSSRGSLTTKQSLLSSECEGAVLRSVLSSSCNNNCEEGVK